MSKQIKIETQIITSNRTRGYYPKMYVYSVYVSTYSNKGWSEYHREGAAQTKEYAIKYAEYKKNHSNRPLRYNIIKETYRYQYPLEEYYIGNGKEDTRGYSHPKAPDADRVYRFTQKLHGSGIDYDWHIQETKTSIRASNSFHTMNDVGMYDRIVNFTVIFPKGEPMSNFKLQFGDTYGAQKYMLREYLEDTIASVLNELNL